MLYKKIKYLICSCKENIVFANRFLPFMSKRAILFQTPEHNNIGDIALLLSERILFRNMKVIEVTYLEYLRFKSVIQLFVRKKDVILIQAGGNMGSVWEYYEDNRRDIIKTFGKNKIISLPQSVYFENTPFGKESLRASVDTYGAHKNLVLIARERYSYDIMKKVFSKNRVYLIPDLALYLKYEQNNKVRKGILLCIREDAERAISDEDRQKIVSALKGKEYRYTDMYCNIKLNDSNIKNIVYTKMLEFANAELVITDRLHGMVFATITETPCVALSNSYHKLRGVYEWIKDLPYVKHIDNVNEMEDAIKKVISAKKIHYDNSKFLPYYDKMIEIINEK